MQLRTDDGLLNQIGGGVKEQRAVLRLTQDALCARLADVTGATWHAHGHKVVATEKGIRAVTTVERIALARALEISPCVLLMGSEDQATNLPN